MDLWPSGSLVLWLSDPLALWLSGSLVLWFSGSPALWLSGSLTLWLLLSFNIGHHLCISVHLRYVEGQCRSNDELDAILDGVVDTPTINKDTRRPTIAAEAFGTYWEKMKGWRESACCRPNLTATVKNYIASQAVRLCGDVARLPPFWIARKVCSASPKALTLLPYNMHVVKSMLVTAWDIICRHTGLWPASSSTTTSTRCAEATKALLQQVKAKRAAGDLRRDVSVPATHLDIWFIGSLALWLRGWLSGSITLCSLVVWFSGSLVFWFSGSLALWVSGSLTLWLIGFLDLWLRGSLALCLVLSKTLFSSDDELS